MTDVWAPGTWSMRVLRAGVFALLSTLLAAAAHRIGGGTIPGLAVTGPAVLVLFLVGLSLTRRERGGRSISALVLLTQLLMHAGLVLGPALIDGGGQSQTALWGKLLFCHHGGKAVSAAQIEQARVALGVSHVNLPSTAAAPGAFVSSAMVAMLAAHLLAAAAMAWWLRRGERAAWRRVLRVVDSWRPVPRAIAAARVGLVRGQQLVGANLRRVAHGRTAPRTTPPRADHPHHRLTRSA